MKLNIAGMQGAPDALHNTVLTGGFIASPLGKEAGTRNPAIRRNVEAFTADSLQDKDNLIRVTMASPFLLLLLLTGNNINPLVTGVSENYGT